MDLYSFSNYKEFTLKWIKSQPKKGYGQLRKLAQHLDINAVIVTQVFNGPRNLSVEQAFDATSFFGLNELESDYYLLLVQHERAGNYRLQDNFAKKIKELKTKATKIKSRLPKNKQELSFETKALFYSDWFYSGIRLITAIDGFNSPEAIANYFYLPVRKVREVLDFLTENNLCIEKKTNTPS